MMKSIRKTALGVLIACVAQFAVFPLAFGVTVEEAAGKKEKAAPPPYYEEFSGKAAERRDDARAYQEKDPRLACLLSLILPGSGHIYLKEDLKGVTFCLLTGIGYASSAYYLYLALYSDDLSQTEQKSKLIISGLLFVVAAIIHVVGIVEAYNDAIEINEKKFYYGGNRSESPYVAGIDYR
jgi:hypothetical protein